MNIKYHLINPTGNITILVETPVRIEEQPKIGSLLMQKEPSCEQVGFIQKGDSESDIVLRMAGGEFCGNATMSTAAFFCRSQELASGESRNVAVKILGVNKIVNVTITREDNVYFGKVEMPRPNSIKNERFYYEGRYFPYPIVEFKGISHMVVEDDMPISMAERAIKKWCDDFHLEGLGIMLVNRELTSLRPLVYIKDADTLVWESSCASGTTAVGAYLCKRDNEDKSFSFAEPGGTLTIEAFTDGRLILGGQVLFD